MSLNTAWSAGSGETSCDIITGASCFIEEGCDCDHDGYVRKKGKSGQYCHYDRCPIDGDDDNPSVLGVPSENNLDGDGWTTSFDCDDNNSCVGNSCEPIPNCSPDMDNDGFVQGDDCDDSNSNIYPEAPIACCSCEVLSTSESRAEFDCESNPCAEDSPQTNSGTPETGRVGAPYEDAVASPPLWASQNGNDATMGGGAPNENTTSWSCATTPYKKGQGPLSLLCFILFVAFVRKLRLTGA
jgi:hypothetical protein